MRLLHNRQDNGIIYLGDLSFIKVFEVFWRFLFHLAGTMYIIHKTITHLSYNP